MQSEQVKEIIGTCFHRDKEFTTNTVQACSMLSRLRTANLCTRAHRCTPLHTEGVHECTCAKVCNGVQWCALVVTAATQRNTWKGMENELFI